MDQRDVLQPLIAYLFVSGNSASRFPTILADLACRARNGLISWFVE
jgi:hypothetical protein